MPLFLCLTSTLLTLSGCAAINEMTGQDVVQELQDIGIPARAMVLEIWDTGVRLNDDLVVGFKLEVWPENEDSYEAETRAVIPILYIPRIQPGSILPIKVHPQDPRTVALDIYEKH
jgi:hypothetical protein